MLSVGKRNRFKLAVRELKWTKKLSSWEQVHCHTYGSTCCPLDGTVCGRGGPPADAQEVTRWRAGEKQRNVQKLWISKPGSAIWLAVWLWTTFPGSSLSGAEYYVLLHMPVVVRPSPWHTASLLWMSGPFLLAVRWPNTEHGCSPGSWQPAIKMILVFITKMCSCWATMCPEEPEC